MAQVRIYNPGAVLTQRRTSLFNKVISGPGLYSGYTPTITGDWQVTIAPGELVTPTGLVVIEEDTVTPDPLPVISSPTDYTLLAAQADTSLIGGAPVLYTWEEGILPASNVADGSVAVLYVRHPGVGVLDEGMLSTPTYRKNSAILEQTNGTFTWIAAPFTTACDVTKSSNNVVITNASSALGAQYLGWSVANTSVSSTQTLQFRLPIPILHHAREISLYATLPSSASIAFNTGTFTSRTEAGDVLTLTPTSVSGPVTVLTAPAVTSEVSSTEAQMASLGISLTITAGTTVFFWGVQIVTD
jgi:hypothetical protein